MFWQDLLFPKFCLGCNKPGAYLCLNCQNKLEYFNQDICLYCGKKSLFGLTHPGCQRRFGIDGFFTVFKYNKTLKQVIKAFKYRRALHVWQDFSLIIRPERLTKLNSWPKADFLQPVPLHSNKFNERGFNQAETIALFFNQFLKLELSDLLVRQKETKPQAQITTKKERRLNLSRAFTTTKNNKIENSVIILVDDLLTTGDTVKEAGKILKKKGTDRVFVLTLAKG